MRERPRLLQAVAVLAGLTLALYAPVRGFDFLVYDDGSYVYANPHVRPGLSWEGVRWAFTRTHAANWHPLTWLSHMLDAELFGMRWPGGHHATSAVLHAAAAALLLLALRSLGAAFWPSAWAAAFFAWHPLRVESVAWVAERKDVLAGVLFAATLWAWAAWTRRRGAWRYALVLALFALGLAAKPMLVTVPAVLLLLDLWPLGRLRAGARRLVLEKLPLVLLAAVSCAVTVHAQERGGAVRPLLTISFEHRLSNAITSVWRYVGKTLWPEPLAVFYPHPTLVDAVAFDPWNAGVLVALAALGASMAAAVLAARRRAYVTTGWLWFLGMLVPVIGLVQVGEQALADRYTYLPGIGLGIVLAFGAHELARHRPSLRWPLAVLGAAALAALLTATRRQLAHWRDSESLFEHALAVTESNYVAHFNLGVAREAGGDLGAARASYERALAIKPDASDARYNLGALALEEGRLEEAEEHLRRTLALRPRQAQARINLAIVLARQGRGDEAVELLEQILEHQPASAAAHWNLGKVHARAGDFESARRHLEAALRAEPDLARARLQLGQVLLELGEVEAAARAFEEAAASEEVRDEARRWRAVARRRLRDPSGGGDGG